MTPYYDDGQCVIYHGDALELMADVVDVDAVILDPPYSFESISVRGRVLDPYMGLAASGIAAVRCGHKWIGIEINEAYCEIAATRLGAGVLDFGGAA